MSQQKTTTTSSVAAVIENDLEDVSEDVIISCSSPVAAKLLSTSGTTSTTEPSSTSGGGCNAMSAMVAVKRSPTVAPSVVPRLLAKSAAAEIVTSEVGGVLASDAVGGLQFVGAVMESPSKRKLRMSVSCDNYLGDGKFSLCRRDSVGSGSPHSSKVNK